LPEGPLRERLAQLAHELGRRLDDRRLDARDPLEALEAELAGTAWQTRFAPVGMAVRALEFPAASRELRTFGTGCGLLQARES
jgi:hypothetical protein